MLIARSRTCQKLPHPEWEGRCCLFVLSPSVILVVFGRPLICSVLASSAIGQRTSSSPHKAHHMC